jgi:hypothetical protein
MRGPQCGAGWQAEWGEGVHQLAASRQPGMGRRAGVVWGEPQLTVLLCCWPHPAAGGLGQVAGGWSVSQPAQRGKTSSHKEG